MLFLSNLISSLPKTETVTMARCSGLVSESSTSCMSAISWPVLLDLSLQTCLRTAIKSVDLLQQRYAEALACVASPQRLRFPTAKSIWQGRRGKAPGCKSSLLVCVGVQGGFSQDPHRSIWIISCYFLQTNHASNLCAVATWLFCLFA